MSQTPLLSNSSDAFTASAAINTTSTLVTLFMLLYFSLLLFCYESSVNPALIFGLMFFVPQCIDIATKHFEFTADALPLIHLSTLSTRESYRSSRYCHVVGPVSASCCLWLEQRTQDPRQFQPLRRNRRSQRG